MVAATESSIKEMIEKVKVEAGDEEKCMICLEEVEVGFEASQMPFSHILAVLVESGMDVEIWMTRALTEITCELESINDMFAANESSIKEMIERVKVEAGEEDCMICLEELKVSFEASRMPCSHVFHGDCMEKWLKQSHYCPICRFEMPTD
ncbi:hypothetical protein Golob_012256 [Gossypium lobatum]|uniref:RING-type E3 ubiquitin transferase n=1 Tax=Gossypium lobatum TaxID=34289 RepID=A0A7J8LKR5_9ROSI|nr:hypothetical protein [Gossypium lobatum]